MTPSPLAIDVDDVSTWPEVLVGAVDEAIERLIDDGREVDSTWLGDDVEELIQVALAGVSVRLYHSTRLLPHEVAGIRAEGLRPLDGALISRRIQAAVLAGALTDEEAFVLAQTHTPLDGSAGTRAGQVCASASMWNFEYDVYAVWRLLATWGGEAIYWAHEETELAPRLRSIGSPAIVVFGVPAARHGDHWFPSIANVLAAARTGVDGVNADVHVHCAVPPADIETVWMPGSAEYDRFPDLPKC